MNAGGVLNTCKSNEAFKDESSDSTEKLEFNELSGQLLNMRV